MNFADFNLNNNTEIPDSQKTSNAINYLKQLNLSTLVDDSLAYKAIYAIHTLRLSCKRTILNEKCEKLFGDILFELYEKCSSGEIDFTIPFSRNPKEQQNQLDSKNNAHKIKLIAFVLDIIICLTRCVQFCTNFMEHSGLKALLAFLQDNDHNKHVFSRLLLVSPTANPYVYKFYLINELIIAVHNVSKHYASTQRHVWSELNAVRVLLNVAKHVKPSVELLAYLSACNVSSHDEIETMWFELHPVTTKLSEIVANCVQKFRRNLFLRGAAKLLEDAGPIDIDTFGFVLNDTSFSYLIEVLDGLTKLCTANKRLSNEVYFENHIKDHLKVIFKKGDESEKRSALELIAQLALETRVVEDMRNDFELIEYLNCDESVMKDGLAKLKGSLLKNVNNEQEEHKNQVVVEEDRDFDKKVHSGGFFFKKWGSGSSVG
jgi:hypothetical protein